MFKLPNSSYFSSYSNWSHLLGRSPGYLKEGTTPNLQFYCIKPGVKIIRFAYEAKIIKMYYPMPS